LEALPVVVVYSSQRISASAPAFAHFVCIVCSCIGRHLADALPPFCLLADTLPPFYFGGFFAAVAVLVIVSGGCFAASIGRVDALPPLLCCRSLQPWRCSFFWQVQSWMCLGLRVRLCSPSFLLFLICCTGCLPLTWWCFHLNSLCLLRFVTVVLLSS